MGKLKMPGVMDVLFSPSISQPEMYFQTLGAPPLMMMLTNDDIYQLYKIATSLKYNAKIDDKYKLIDQIMRKRGFRKFASGTNRVIYACEENANILLKIAIDRVGIHDNPCEYRNQWLLQPYCCKCFEVSPCGTVGVFERLIPITHIQEFANIANDVFDVLVFKLLGNYILDDVGSDYFMNWAIRRGFGPCLIDFPYVYKLDSNKLYCNREIEFGSKVYCGGEIDYDDGFNNIICKKCGKRYLAKELEDNRISNQIVLKGGSKMKVGYIDDDGKLRVMGMSSNYITPPDAKAKSKKHNSLKVTSSIASGVVDENESKNIHTDAANKIPNKEEFIKAVDSMYKAALSAGMISEEDSKNIEEEEIRQTELREKNDSLDGTDEDSEDNKVSDDDISTTDEDVEEEKATEDSEDDKVSDDDISAVDISVDSKLIQNSKDKKKRDSKGRFTGSSFDDIEDDDNPHIRREKDKKRSQQKRGTNNIKDF